MNSIKNNKEIGKSDRQNIYNIYKTNNDLKDVTIDYNEYKDAMEDIEKFRNVDITKDVKSKSKSLPSTSKKSLIPKLNDNLSKTVENILGQGYNKIKIDQDLLKKNILKVRYKMSKTLRLNVNYIILFKIPKNQLSQIYIDQPININKELFYKIVSELNKYENIIIDLKTHIEKFQIRKNLNEILC